MILIFIGILVICGLALIDSNPKSPSEQELHRAEAVARLQARL
jgi:hypothetical protein